MDTTDQPPEQNQVNDTRSFSGTDSQASVVASGTLNSRPIISGNTRSNSAGLKKF